MGSQRAFCSCLSSLTSSLPHAWVNGLIAGHLAHISGARKQVPPCITQGRAARAQARLEKEPAALSEKQEDIPRRPRVVFRGPPEERASFRRRAMMYHLQRLEAEATMPVVIGNPPPISRQLTSPPTRASTQSLHPRFPIFVLLPPLVAHTPYTVSVTHSSPPGASPRPGLGFRPAWDCYGDASEQHSAAQGQGRDSLPRVFSVIERTGGFLSRRPAALLACVIRLPGPSLV